MTRAMTRAEARRRRALQRATADSSPSGPAAWQERQAPTTAVEVRLGQRLERQGDGRLAVVTLTQARTRRRRLDARLWESFSAEEQAAAECIWFAFSAIARGMGLASCALARERVDGTPADGEGARRLVDLYFRWARLCTAEGVEHATIMDVLGYGLGCAETDRKRRRRKGHTRAQIDDGLALYCRLRGWPQGRY